MIPIESDSDDDGGCTSTCTVTDHLKAEKTWGGYTLLEGSDLETNWAKTLVDGDWSEERGTVFELNNMQIQVKGGASVPDYLPYNEYLPSNEETHALYIRVQCEDEGG